MQQAVCVRDVPREQIHIESKRLFDAAEASPRGVGRDWQRHLVNVGPDKIKAELHEYRETFLALPGLSPSPRRRIHQCARL